MLPHNNKTHVSLFLSMTQYCQTMLFAIFLTNTLRFLEHYQNWTVVPALYVHIEGHRVLKFYWVKKQIEPVCCQPKNDIDLVHSLHDLRTLFHTRAKKQYHAQTNKPLSSSHASPNIITKKKQKFMLSAWNPLLIAAIVQFQNQFESHFNINFPIS